MKKIQLTEGRNDSSRTNVDAGLGKYLQQIGQFLLLTPQQEIALAKKVRGGDTNARNEMIQSNLRLVVTIAKDYVNLGLPLADLISEGTIGLTKAVERFDPAKGAKLSTYAAWWIKRSIKTALSNQVKIIRLPIHLVEKISKVRRLTLELANDLGRAPTDDELAEELGLPAGRVAELRNGFARPASLDAPIDDCESTELSEIIADEQTHTSYDSLRDRDLRAHLRAALEVLDDREKKIVLQRFGLDGSRPKTFDQIGELIGLTRERIHQLQQSAVSKLRRALTKDIRSSHVDLTMVAEAA
jgi:RNA polymerase primary sigma factor